MNYISVMDQYSHRIIGFGVHAATVDGVSLCRMFNRAIRWQLEMPKYLRVLEVTEIKKVPYVPLSHRLSSGSLGPYRECLDSTFILDHHRPGGQATRYPTLL